MPDFLKKFRGDAWTATDLALWYGRYPAYGLQLTSRYALVWFLLAFGMLGIPTLYCTGAIDIETVNQLGRYLCFAIVALSLDLIWGYGGMLCLCQFLFFALGGYAMGMYLAHHGGPEGIIDANNWGKIPACLFVVYPGQIGQSQSEWAVPFFWKPFWNLWTTVILGLLGPGIIAGLIGFFVFRSRVRGVFFAIVTQAIVLASWNVFCINDMKLGGTNGLTRFDRIVVGSREKIKVRIQNEKLAEHQLSIEDLRIALLSAQNHIHDLYRKQIEDRRTIAQQSKFVTGAVFEDPVVTELAATQAGFSISLSRSLHVWQIRDILRSFAVSEVAGQRVTLGDVADVNIDGYSLTDNDVKLGLYIITVIVLAGVFLLFRLLVKSRIGRVLIAVRDNENRLRFSGYEPYVFKTFIFVVSGITAGLAGMLYAPQMRIFTPTNLEPKESILVVVWVAVGGRGTLAGPIAGALGVNYLYSGLTSSAPDAWPFVLGGLFVAVTRFLPDGLMGLWKKWLALPLRLSHVNAEPFIAADATSAMHETATRSPIAVVFGQISAGVAAWRVWGLNLVHAVKSIASKRPAADRRRFAEAFKESSSADNPAGATSADAHVRRNNVQGAASNQLHTGIHPHSETNGRLLHVDRVKVLFDGFQALDIDEFSIGHQEMHVIIGPNGAGKTTLCDVISGKTRPTEGRIFLSGREITKMLEVEISRLGVGRKFQTPTVFDSLTVCGNMELALPGRQRLLRSFSFHPSDDEQSRIDVLLNDVGLWDDRDTLVKHLSHGQRQWLEIGMLILNGPRLLLVDEPAAGLTDDETRKTAAMLMGLTAAHSIIVIEHDMDFVRMLKSPVTVLHEGRIMRRGMMDEIDQDEEVRAAYLGR